MRVDASQIETFSDTNVSRISDFTLNTRVAETVRSNLCRTGNSRVLERALKCTDS